jgi:uncharacterized protein YsxB (DUF464 family)
MTTIQFFTEGEKITGFSSEGHSGYGEAGTDIVCAAITSAIRLTERTLNDVMGIGAKVKVQEASARIKMDLPADALSSTAVQAVLTGLMLYLTDLCDEYPGYLEVLEVEKHA